MEDFLTGVDSILCFLIMLAAIDVLRRSYFPDYPATCISCYLVATGAILVLVIRTNGIAPSLGTVVMHTGMVAYLFADWRAIFMDTWAWFGKDRRKAKH